MLRDSHILVANLAMTSLSQSERYILFPRWGGIESGATLSDEFKIMWEIEEVGSSSKQLVHRCYIDSDNSKDHGCITRSLDHAEGSISFIQDYLAGNLEGAYNETEFLENLGMFIGVVSHHIADLCTPVHVGHKINFKSLGYKTLSRFHSQVENDIKRFTKETNIRLPKPKIVKISKNYFWQIANETYSDIFMNLEHIYQNGNRELKHDMVSFIISNAIKHTADIWHTILHKTKMTDKKWSMTPLL